eukprot:gnl/MRDRNA2_/MRDRNA2_74702_c0_seq2.p1 gnl/MRDRNA2_/MRDRNA2_74702_c0~~gnl/MRDRNA2_/MRDRNA2_74702_c0_seq2.p1  ORF type:complete len:937 (+),score=101.82 gnl/MRDRNA2_/MRDRNA2_74702_c0_seq2:70-2811(+)
MPQTSENRIAPDLSPEQSENCSGPEDGTWQWLHKSGWRNYMDSQNIDIENAFQRGDQRHRVRSGKEGKTPMELFFADMVQYDPFTGNTRKIRRCGHESFSSKARRLILGFFKDISAGKTNRHKSFLKYKQKLMQSDPSMGLIQGTPENCSEPPRSAFCKRITDGIAFSVLQALSIFLFTFVIAMDVELNGTDATDEVRSAFKIIENIFCSIFTLELIFRFGSMEKERTIVQALQKSLQDPWFVFDFFLCGLMVIETWVLPLIGNAGSGLEKLSVMRGIRLAKLFRIGRILHFLRWFPEMLLMVKSVIAAMRAVICTFGLLLMLLYCFAIIFMVRCRETGPCAEIFPGLAISMWKLLAHGAFIDDFTEFVEEVYQADPIVALLLLIFVGFSHLTVLNMLIGIICEVALDVSNQEKMLTDQRCLKNDFLEFLECFDLDEDAMISRDEFELLLNNPDARAMLERHQLDMAVLDALKDSFFEDKDKTNYKTGFEPVYKARNFDELCSLILRFKNGHGNLATYIDIINLNKSLSSDIGEIGSAIGSQFHRTTRIVEECSHSDTPGTKGKPVPLMEAPMVAMGSSITSSSDADNLGTIQQTTCSASKSLNFQTEKKKTPLAPPEEAVVPMPTQLCPSWSVPVPDIAEPLHEPEVLKEDRNHSTVERQKFTEVIIEKLDEIMSLQINMSTEGRTHSTAERQKFTEVIIKKLDEIASLQVSMSSRLAEVESKSRTSTQASAQTPTLLISQSVQTGEPVSLQIHMSGRVAESESSSWNSGCGCEPNVQSVQTWEPEARRTHRTAQALVPWTPLADQEGLQNEPEVRNYSMTTEKLPYVDGQKAVFHSSLPAHGLTETKPHQTEESEIRMPSSPANLRWSGPESHRLPELVDVSRWPLKGVACPYQPKAREGMQQFSPSRYTS